MLGHCHDTIGYIHWAMKKSAEAIAAYKEPWRSTERLADAQPSVVPVPG